MVKRKAKYIVDTARYSRINDKGKFVNYADAPFLIELADLEGYKEKPNPRINTKRPHHRLYRFDTPDGGKGYSMSWAFTTEDNAKRFVKNKKKQLSQKYGHNRRYFDDDLFEYWWD